MSTVPNDTKVWKEPPLVWLSLLTALSIAIFLFHDGLLYMLHSWQTEEEYSYGYLIPFISLFLIWQKKEILRSIPFTGSWFGVGLTLVGVVTFLLGYLSAVYSIVQYSFVVVLFGLALAFVGRTGFKVLWIPLLILAFMVPLPGFLNQTLSNQLQLWSSRLGVAIIHLLGISVYLEGNIVDLGTYKLQVAEACSGLRYLFPLMTFGFIAAYFYKAVLWKRTVLFISTIPITIFMNSFRIAFIGVTVQLWGPTMAEGFLHDFEGWAVFMMCTGVLVVEMWLLLQVGGDRCSLREAFGLTLPARAPRHFAVEYRSMPIPFFMAVALVFAVSTLSYFMPSREEVIPPRKDFALFPMDIGKWHGKEQRLGQQYVDSLNFDDYLLADYMRNDRNWINLYVGYYQTQRADKVPHSPRACIPGGGWQITKIEDYYPPGVTISRRPLKVNRLVIEKGTQKQLVYYWFQQRGRDITNEYLVKWFIFWDSLRRHRSDGSLVRFITPVATGEETAQADRRLNSFLRVAVDKLPPYVPD